MKVLVIGSGGREHALAWKAAQSDRVTEVLVAPGNAGTAREPGVRNVPLDPMDFPALMAFVRDEGVDLTLVGPEAPLVAGIVDAFEAEGLPCFGPRAAAAQLEGSKAFTKAFLARHGIPTAAYAVFEVLGEAEAYVRTQGAPIVIKADGLAAGKGVVVAETEADALAALQAMLGSDAPAGSRVVIEEFMAGEEASFIVMADGEDFLPFPTSQDHKRRFDGDEGPNTGGMGAYSPAPVVSAEVEARVLDRIVRPTLRGLLQDGISYRGFLYVGLMIDAAGNPRVVEFNCRFGDPEAQPVLSRVRSDLTVLCEAALAGRLGEMVIDEDPDWTVGVVVAMESYPGAYPKGEPIDGLDRVQGAKVFHAGTRLGDSGAVETDGGRVLCVVGKAPDFQGAREKAYAAIKGLSFPSLAYRTDIGHRAVSP